MGLYSIIRSARWSATKFPAKRYAQLLQESERWSRDRLEDYRDSKLREIIAHCHKHVPYYRKVMKRNGIRPEDITCASDLRKLPVLTKEILRTHSGELMAEDVSERAISWNRTGGTTGEPIKIAKNIECGAWDSMCYERGLKWGGKSVDEPRVLLFGGTLGINKQRVTTKVGNIFRRDVFIPAFELRADNAVSYFDRIRRSKCRFVVGYASAIYRLARLASELGQKIEFSVVFPTAELILPEWEEVIRNTFNCAVLPFYGCGEVNSLGFSRLGSNGYLIPEEHALIEIMDGSSVTQLYGEGRFLVTDLDNYAMPIVRYANGDAGTLARPNGQFPYSRIERLDGRYNSLLMTESGDLISGVIGTHVFRLTSSVKSYRVIQEEPLRITIKVVPKENRMSDEDEHLVLSLFGKYLGRGVTVTIETLRDLPTPPSGKSVFVINRCLR